MLLGRGLCDKLTTRPEESYRTWCVAVCDIETSSIVNELKSRRYTYITGRISCMPLIVTVNTIAECLRTDCSIYRE